MPILSRPPSENGQRISRQKYVPVCFSRLPNEVLGGFALYLRSLDAKGSEVFTLYASPDTPFTSEHRRRLHELGAQFLYLPAAEQARLRRNLEDSIEKVSADQRIDLAMRCEIVYEAACELVDEALNAGNLHEAVPRMRRVASSLVRLHLESPHTFTHFYGAAKHDPSGATHAANVASWLPALAMSMGEKEKQSLITTCMGALLYDVGMAALPPGLRQHTGKYSAVERQAVQQHPELGAQMLREIPGLDPLVSIMALQHQERLDGSGYPRRLTFDRIHAASRMLSVVDTYEALTSFRPYRDANLQAGAAVELLRNEATHHYDPKIVVAWTELLRGACPEALQTAAAVTQAVSSAGISRRRFERYAVKCPATLVKLECVNGIWTNRGTMEAMAQNLSRGGLGLLTRVRLNTGEYYRAKIRRRDGMVTPLELIIVRTRDARDGWFEAGARFVDLAREALTSNEFSQ
jgi:HD-GYP domain-containing protein (c-di-GMP phosphodiesterase class II)